jgi:hypothetical protein
VFTDTTPRRPRRARAWRSAFARRAMWERLPNEHLRIGLEAVVRRDRRSRQTWYPRASCRDRSRRTPACAPARLIRRTAQHQQRHEGHRRGETLSASNQHRSNRVNTRESRRGRAPTDDDTTTPPRWKLGGRLTRARSAPPREPQSADRRHKHRPHLQSPTSSR